METESLDLPICGQPVAQMRLLTANLCHERAQFRGRVLLYVAVASRWFIVKSVESWCSTHLKKVNQNFMLSRAEAIYVPNVWPNLSLHLPDQIYAMSLTSVFHFTKHFPWACTTSIVHLLRNTDNAKLCSK